jgi:hypothetical protein
VTISERARRPSRPALTSLLVLFSVALASGAVHAQGQAERQEALGLLREGNRLFDTGDYQAALSRYKQAYARVPSPKVLFNIGQTERALGRFVEAHASYDRFLTEAADASAALRAEAERRRAELEKATATIEISAERDGTPVPGVQVSVDGVGHGATPLPRPVRVMPGPHQVVVEPGGGAPPVVTRVEVQADMRSVVRAQLPGAALPGRGAAQAPAEPVRPPLASSATEAPPAPAAVVGTTAAATSASHRGRVGLAARVDLDWRLQGAGVAGALTWGVTERFEIAAGGFAWPVGGQAIAGASLGTAVYLSDGRLRPLLAAEAQIYFLNGVPHPAGRAGLGLAWDVTAHLALLAGVAVQHVFGPLTLEARTFAVPSLGVVGRI